jgi:hypothetical protein
MYDQSEVPERDKTKGTPFAHSDLVELRRITSAVVRAIEAGELDAAPGQYGALYGPLALATALTSSQESEDITA